MQDSSTESSTPKVKIVKKSARKVDVRSARKGPIPIDQHPAWNDSFILGSPLTASPSSPSKRNISLRGSKSVDCSDESGLSCMNESSGSAFRSDATAVRTRPMSPYNASVEIVAPRVRLAEKPSPKNRTDTHYFPAQLPYIEMMNTSTAVACRTLATRRSFNPEYAKLFKERPTSPATLLREQAKEASAAAHSAPTPEARALWTIIRARNSFSDCKKSHTKPITESEARLLSR